MAQAQESVGVPGESDLALIFIPMATYRALANEAAKRGMVVGAMVAKALDLYLKETAETPAPQLLTEER